MIARKTSSLALVCATVVTLAAPASPRADAESTAPGFRWLDGAGARGLHIELAADGHLVHDIYSIALDENARVYVSGPGSIRRLIDRDEDGRFDEADEFWAGPASGCQGMVFVGRSLFTTGGRGLERYDDRDGDGRADGPPTLLVPLATGGEHSSHALRHGPDGLLYFLGGNYCGLPAKRVSTRSPITAENFYAGVFTRMTLDANEIEVRAHGMRNAYDFDFTPTGDVFGWDSDSERDEGLAWYRPCRVYHFTPGTDCGWRSIGTGKIPLDAIDSSNPVAEKPRGSPTGVVSYRPHSASPRALPARFHGGLFLCDWTHGVIDFVAPRPDSGGYAAEVEPFLAASGTVSFAPTDIVETPDGSLLVSSGGRGIAGSVWRILGERLSQSETRDETWIVGDSDDESRTIASVLDAPAPLEAWSRSRWTPKARELGAEPFLRVLADASTPRSRPLRSAIDTTRALEILVELFPAEAHRFLRLARSSLHETVRALGARYTSDLPVEPPRTLASALARALEDPSPLVQRAGADALLGLFAKGSDTLDEASTRSLTNALLALGPSPHRRVRQAAIAALSRSPQLAIPESSVDLGTATTLLWLLARVAAAPRDTLDEAMLASALAIPARLVAGSPERDDLLLDSLRLIHATWERLKSRDDPRSATFDSAWDAVDLGPWRSAADRTIASVTSLADHPDRQIAREAWRIASRLHASSEEIVTAMLDRISDASPVAEDVETLWLLANCDGEWSDTLLDRLALAGLDLPRKLRAQSTARDNKWRFYQRGIWERHLEKRPSLAARIANHPRFGEVEHLDLLDSAPSEILERVASLWVDRGLPPDPQDARAVLDLIERHTKDREALRRIARARIDETALSDIWLRVLAESPEPGDRDVFLAALEGEDARQLDSALRGLSRLDARPGEDETLALLVWAHRLPEGEERGRAERIERRITVALGSPDGDDRASREAAWRASFERLHPARAADLAEAVARLESADRLVDRLLAEVDWTRGDRERGRAVYEARGCGNCHHLGGRGERLGPELGGVAKRYDRRALLLEIAAPSRRVPERYRVREITLTDGSRIEGITVYSAGSALVLVTREGLYRRLDPRLISSSALRPWSLMPSGLLAGLREEDVADLIAFLEDPK